MKKFVSIFFKDNLDNTNIHMLTDFFKGLVGANLEERVNENVISYIFDDGLNINFEEIILGINADFYLSLKLYESQSFSDFKFIYQYLDMVESLKVNTISEDYFTDDELVIKNLGNIDLIKARILQKFVNDYSMLEVIKAYLDSNMNTTQAANNLFMHRNTVMNKIEKFIEVTGYDIRKFKKAFVIYHLIY